MKKYSKKLMLGSFVLFAVIIVVLMFVFAIKSRPDYYECTEFKLSMKVVDESGLDETSENYLKNYSYYRLYIYEKKSTCKLVYKEKGSSLEKTEEGVYTKQSDGIIILKFKNYAMEPENIYFKKNGDKLVRIDATTKKPGDFVISPSRGTIYQTFKK